MFPQRTLAVTHVFGNLDVQDDVQVAASTAALGETLSPETEPLPVSRAGWDLQVRPAVQQRHRDGRSQHSVPRSDLQIVIQIALFISKKGLLRETDPQKQIARLPITHATLTLAAQPQELPLVHTGGDFHLVGFRAHDLASTAALRTNLLIDSARPTALVAENRSP